MVDKNGRRIGRVYFRFALVLIVALMDSAARAAAPNDTGSAKNKPTIEELEQRIQILEQKLDAQTRAHPAPKKAPPPPQPPLTPAQQAAPAAQQPVAVQQAASATVSSPQIY